MSEWTYTLYAFVPAAQVGAFLDFASLRLIEAGDETYILNRWQYSASGSQPYEYAACNIPLPNDHLSAFVDALSNAFTGAKYYITSFPDGVVAYTSSGTVSVGSTLTHAGAIADAMIGKSVIASPVQLQLLSTTYDADDLDGMGVTEGGNGGAVLYVVKLDDDNTAGTLRWACTRAFKRHIKVAVTGIITLLSDLNCEPEMNLEPEDGYAFMTRGEQFSVGSDTIVKNCRFTNGIPTNNWGYADAFALRSEADGVVMLNCEVLGGADSCIEHLGQNLLLYRTLVADAFYNEKGINVTQGGEGFTMLECVVADVSDRPPTFFSGGRVDLFRNIFAFNGTPTNFEVRDGSVQVNAKNNLMIPRRNPNPNVTYHMFNTPVGSHIDPDLVSASGIYLEGNTIDIDAEATQADMIQPSDRPSVGQVMTPYTDQYYPLASVGAMDEASVLANVGAMPRDSWAQTVIDEIASRSWSAQVLHQDARDGYPDLESLFE